MPDGGDHLRTGRRIARLADEIKIPGTLATADGKADENPLLQVPAAHLLPGRFLDLFDHARMKSHIGIENRCEAEGTRPLAAEDFQSILRSESPEV